jgi:hypothetical protein
MKTAFGNRCVIPHAIILVPYWMKERLNARQESLNSLLVFKKAAALFSVNDLAGLLALQKKMHYLSGMTASLSTPDSHGNCNITYTGNSPVNVYPEFNRGFNTWDDLNDHWAGLISSEDQTLYNTATTLALSDEVSKEIDARLFSSAVEMSDPEDPHVFEMINIDSTLTYIIVKPGRFDCRYTERNPNRLKLLETILQSFYRTMETHLVSRTLWFESYVKTLNEK